MDETTVSFNRREREQTCWIELRFPTAARPQPLLDGLAAIGFVGDGMREAPPVNGVETTRVSKSGSALFGGWTADEKKANMTEARRVLRNFGFTKVPVNALGYFDLN
jgi:hypothetical protein